MLPEITPKKKKRKKWSGLKEGIIMYLAISKIFYWMNNIGELAQRDWEGAGEFVLDRILNQDLPIILVVACLVIIDMVEGKFYIKLAIGYVAYLIIVVVYSTVVNWIFQGEPIDGLVFFREHFLGFTIQFAIVALILELKERFMNKVKDKPEDESEEHHE